MPSPFFEFSIELMMVSVAAKLIPLNYVVYVSMLVFLSFTSLYMSQNEQL